MFSERTDNYGYHLGEALAEARQSAWRRSCEHSVEYHILIRRLLFTQDRIYLSGYLDVSHYLEYGEERDCTLAV